MISIPRGPLSKNQDNIQNYGGSHAVYSLDPDNSEGTTAPLLCWSCHTYDAFDFERVIVRLHNYD